ncbi:MAG TPA: hypothetical protein VID73_11510 [Ktedonobacterales bacterium]|jgi:hypothetical protein
MPPDDSIVLLFDVDNTLLDNDALKADLHRQLGALLGAALNARFWEHYEAVRQERDVVDLPLALERFAPLCPDPALAARARAIVMDYPFASRLYPATLAALAHARALGTPAILSDGDAVYQPRKIAGSGLAAAVGERVQVYIHKEQHVAAVMAAWPAALYVAVDDKARILAALVEQQPRRFVTVHVRQGHYADDPPAGPEPDITLAGIGDLQTLSAADLWRHARR